MRYWRRSTRNSWRRTVCREEPAVTTQKEGFKQNVDNSQAWIREQENEECIGGLRNPYRAVQLVSGWRPVGDRLFRVLGVFQQQYSDLDVIPCVGKLEGFSQFGTIDVLQSSMAKCLGIAKDGRIHGLWSNFLRKLVRDAKDPDEEVATWLEKGTPLGIEESIIPGGVFPAVRQEFAGQEAERLQAIDGLMGADGSYIAYEENKLDADELFAEEVKKGFVHWSTDKEALESKYGRLVQSSIGVIVK